MPKAPGTWGSVAGLGVWWLCRNMHPGVFALVVLALCVLACGVCEQVEKSYGAHDLQWIVIDEVAGVCVTAIGVPWGLWQACAVFVVFRALDIWKPGPVGWVDEHVGGGVGVVMDDVAAGVLGCAAIHAVRLLGGAV
jgi:phosphatidylglycerophosphatase A